MLRFHRFLIVAMVLPAVALLLAQRLHVDVLWWCALLAEALLGFAAVLVGATLLLMLLYQLATRGGRAYLAAHWLGLVNGLIGAAYFVWLLTAMTTFASV